MASEAAAASGDAATALALADDAVERAPLRRAPTARMRAHAAAGNRGEALLAYQRLRRVLADALGVDPDIDTERRTSSSWGRRHHRERRARSADAREDATRSGASTPAPSWVGTPSWPCSALRGTAPPAAPATSSSSPVRRASARPAWPPRQRVGFRHRAGWCCSAAATRKRSCPTSPSWRRSTVTSPPRRATSCRRWTSRPGPSWRRRCRRSTGRRRRTRRALTPLRRRHDPRGVGGGRPPGAAGARRPPMGRRRHPAARPPPATAGR